MQALSKKKEITEIILWGFIGGIFLAVIFFFLQAIWEPICDYNTSIIIVKNFQLLVSCFILFFILGMAASDLFCTGRKNEPGPAFTGLLSGITTAFVFSSIYVLLSRPYLFSWDNGILEVNTGLKLIEWLILSTFFGITSGILQALGAWYRHSRRESKPKKTDVREKPTFSGVLYTYRFLILILLALLVIPQVAAYIGIENGSIKWDNGFNRPFEYAEASRTTDGSIHILMRHDIISPQKGPGLRFLNITIDGKDVSTQSVIAGSGLNLSIDPPRGLAYQDNSSAILTGDYLYYNPVLLRVNVTYTDLGFRDVIYYETI